MIIIITARYCGLAQAQIYCLFYIISGWRYRKKKEKRDSIHQGIQHTQQQKSRRERSEEEHASLIVGSSSLHGKKRERSWCARKWSHKLPPNSFRKTREESSSLSFVWGLPKSERERISCCCYTQGVLVVHNDPLIYIIMESVSHLM